MSTDPDDETQRDLLSDATEISLIRRLLADLHDDLLGKVQRFRFLNDLGERDGRRRMLFGGHLTYNAWIEARSSFVHGNYVGTVLLCQSLVENLLAAFLHGGKMDALPDRIRFDETLRRCLAAKVIDEHDVVELKQLVDLRNPLTHFRSIDDERNLDRRSMATGKYSSDILSRDAWFAISVASRIMGKQAFRLGNPSTLLDEQQ
jgi:hypothetical protein